MKAVLFDFFGTLVEYEPDRAQLASPQTHRLACACGFRGDHDDFVRTWNRASMALDQTARATQREYSMTDAAAAFGEHAGLDLSRDVAIELGRSYVSEWSRHIRPVAGVAEMVRRLAQVATVSVVSNTHDVEMVPRILGDMGVSGDVSEVLLSVEHGYLKPHPSIYSTALERVGCVAEHALFVGDSYEADYRGPLEAGIAAFLIDPTNVHRVPASFRLESVLDLESRIELLA